MKRDILQRQYDFELDQRNSIASATNIPIVALTILGGALSSMLIGFKYSNNLTTYAFITILLLSVFSMFFSLYFIVRTFLGYSYQKIPPSRSLLNHLKELEEWHRDNGDETENYKEKAMYDFDIYFDEKISEASEHNSNNNIKRGNYLHDATAAVIVSFIFLVTSAPFYIYQKVVKIDNVYKVMIVNEVESINKEKSMTKNKSGGNESDTQQSSPAAAPKPTAAIKPTGPQNVVFKGNCSKKEIKLDISPGPINTKKNTDKK